MAKLSPYLRFNDNKCREAMNFYKDCLGGDLIIQTVGETPMAKDMAPETHSRIMHATLKTPTLEFSGADMMRDKAIVGDNIDMALLCNSKEEIEGLFAKFSEGADVFMPLQKVFWGATFGVLTDKFGIEWMFNFQEN